jgi:hypothetical protein
VKVSAQTTEGGVSTSRERAVYSSSGSRRPLAATLVLGVLASVALGFGLRALGRALLDVPDALPALAAATLIPATVFPILGNCFGFYMSFYRKPSHHSMSVFLAIGATMTLVGIAISATKLPATANAGSVTTTIAVSLAPAILIIPALLQLIRRADRARPET